MQEAAPPRPRALDRLRPLESLPFGPVWLGLGVWAALVALYFAWCALFGQLDLLLDARRPLYLTPSARIQIVIALLIAFVLAARRHLVGRPAEDWAPIRPLTRLSAERFRALVAEGASPAARRRPLVGAAGALLGVWIVFLSIDADLLAGRAAWTASTVWALGANALLFAMIADAAHATLVESRIEQIAGAISELDLLDTRPLRCFGRQGLRRAFFWVGGSSIGSLLAWNLERIGPTLAIVAATIAIATFALLAPVRAVRRRVREAKRAELERVRQRIRASRDELLAGRAAEGLPALLAYERRIAEVSEWPFDASTLLRFGALGLLAAGSWLGGALVERLLDAALG